MNRRMIGNISRRKGRNDSKGQDRWMMKNEGGWTGRQILQGKQSPRELIHPWHPDWYKQGTKICFQVSVMYTETICLGMMCMWCEIQPRIDDNSLETGEVNRHPGHKLSLKNTIPGDPTKAKQSGMHNQQQISQIKEMHEAIYSWTVHYCKEIIKIKRRQRSN